MRPSLLAFARLTGCGLSLLTTFEAGAQPAVAAPFAGSYSVRDLGAIPGVPTPYGGLTLKAGTTDRLLVGGNAGAPDSVIYEIAVTRDAQGHIDGFASVASPYASAPFLDGGLQYAPNGVLLYTSNPFNSIGQILPGSTAPDQVDSLDPLGVVTSTGGLAFVAPGLPGAGRLKVSSFGGNAFYDVPIALSGGNGLHAFDEASLEATISSGPEGFSYLPAGIPAFPDPAVMVALFEEDRIVVYDLGPNGEPDPATGRSFVTALPEPEGAYFDASAGDALFTTWGTNPSLLLVGDLTAVPEPAAAATAVATSLALVALARRRSRSRSRSHALPTARPPAIPG